MSGRTLRVAVVDDSTFIRKALTRMLADDPRIDVVGSAGSGEELLAHVEEWNPDVITLDLDMPGMGGLETLDHVRQQRTTPVIILSTHSGEGAPMTIEALHRGATDFIDKQRYSLVDFEALREVLLRKIFQVTSELVVADATGDEVGQTTMPAPPREPEPPEIPGAYDVVVLGASTGGPPTIERILDRLGDVVPVPVVVVQHMPVGFTQAFAERLNAHLPLGVREATSGEKLVRDTAYIAPAGLHLRLVRRDADLYVELDGEPADATHVPSIDILFRSAARTVGSRAVGVLLTGMGRDGAEGLARLRARGAYTLVQDEASSIVFGMPRAAMALGAACEIGPPSSIAERIRELVALPGG